MATSLLDNKIIDRFDTENLIIGEDLWYANNQSFEDILDAYFIENKRLDKSDRPVEVEAKESNDPECFVSYKKGCGKWINTAKGCPFSSASGLISDNMTINERRVIELWKKMVNLYNASI
jgi:hypothetical protein